LSDFVSEAGHWYTKDGKPAYTQVVASGKNKGGERPTTIRDARSQNLLPSVTTITSILDKPALTLWKVHRAVDLFKWEVYQWLKESRAKSIAPSFKLMFKVTQPDMEDKAGRGSEIHAALEQWLGGGGVMEGFEPYIDILDEVIASLGLSLTDAVAERSFAAKEGYGGAVDLHFIGNQPVIIDFKTKDMTHEEAEKMKAYDEHVMQLAAYRMGLGMPENTRLFNLFLSRDNPTAYKLIEWNPVDIVWGENAFLSVFNTWKIMKRYDPHG